jgi:hypothetical protein
MIRHLQNNVNTKDSFASPQEITVNDPNQQLSAVVYLIYSQVLVDIVALAYSSSRREYFR